MRAAIAALQAEGSTALNDAVVLGVKELGDDGQPQHGPAVRRRGRGQRDLGEERPQAARGVRRRARRRVRWAGQPAEGTRGLRQGRQRLAGHGNRRRRPHRRLRVGGTERRHPVGRDGRRYPRGSRRGPPSSRWSPSSAIRRSPTPRPRSSRRRRRPSPTAPATGPIAVPPSDPGLFDQPFFLIAVIAAIFLALAAITSLAVGAIDSKNRKEGRVSRRLEEVSVMGPPIGQVAPAKPADRRWARAPSCARPCPSPIVSRPAGTRPAWRGSSRRRTSPSGPGEWAVVHGLIAVLAALLTTLLTELQPPARAHRLRARARSFPGCTSATARASGARQFYAALPDSMQMLAGSLSAGYSLPQALDNVARESGGAFGQEINRALLESRLGLPLEEALEAVAQRMQSKDFHWVVMAIRINRQGRRQPRRGPHDRRQDPARARAPASAGQDAAAPRACSPRGSSALLPFLIALFIVMAEPRLPGAAGHHRHGMDHDRHRRWSSTSSASSGCATS